MSVSIDDFLKGKDPKKFKTIQNTKKKKVKKEPPKKSASINDMFDSKENYVDKAKNGNLIGAGLNFIGSGLQGAQSVYLNTINNATSLLAGKGTRGFKHNMSYDDYQKDVVKRTGGRTINDAIKSKNRVIGTVAEIAGEALTDPLNLIDAAGFVKNKGLKKMGSSIYSNDLKKSEKVFEATSKTSKANILKDGKQKSVKVKETPKLTSEKSLGRVGDTFYMNSKTKTTKKLPQQPKKATKQGIGELEKLFDAEYERVVNDTAEYIKNYKGKGVQRTVIPKNGDELFRDGGYKVSDSQNDIWYREFYKRNKRKPNKSEAREIAEEYINSGFKYDNEFNGKGSKLYHLNNLIEQEKNGKVMMSPETAKKLVEPDFKNYLIKESKGERIADFAKKEGFSVNDYIEMKYDEFKDLGADTLKQSTTKSNIKNYGLKGSVPAGTPFGETTKGADTFKRSQILDDTTKAKIDELINDGTFSKYTLRNDVASSDAKAFVEKDTEKAYNYVTSIVSQGKMATSKDIALSAELVKKYQSTGEYDKAMEVLVETSQMASESGRTLQSMKIFDALTPEGRLKAVSKMKEGIEKSTGKEVSIPKKLLEDLNNAKTEKEILIAKKNLSVYMWNQVPANWVEKINAWRYLSMLGNPKTHIRNILGNAIFSPVKDIKNIVSAGLEKTLIKDGTKTKAILTPKDNKLLKYAAKDFETSGVREQMRGYSKYFEGARDLDAKVFKSKILEKVKDVNSNLLDLEDVFFMKSSYKKSFAQFVKANGGLTDDVVKRAREYAMQEALNSTYRDANVLAEYLSKAKSVGSKPLSQIKGDLPTRLLKKTASLALESVVPFTKTPLNILERGLEYSPAGIFKFANELYKYKNNATEMYKVIDAFSETLTGTAILGVGYYLAQNGVLNGSLDTSSKEGKYAKMLGEQPYSVTIDDTSVTLDWATPASMALFTGVELYNSMQGDNPRLVDVLDSLTQVSDPLFNLSMLSGVNNAFNNQFADGNVMTTIGRNMAQGYGSQFFPTFGRQIATSIDDTTRTAVSTDINPNVRNWERYKDTLTNKVPVLSQKNEPYINLWGEEDKRYSSEQKRNAALINFLSPAYIKKKDPSAVDRELLKLKTELGDEEWKDVLPRNTTDYTIKFDGKEYRMTKSQLTRFKQTRGSVAKESLLELTRTDAYDKMSVSDKKKKIKSIYDESMRIAKEEFLKDRGVKKSEIAFSKLSDKKKQQYGNLKIGKKQYVDALKKADTDKNGYYKKDEAISYINNTSLSSRQKKALFEILCPNANNPY